MSGYISEFFGYRAEDLSDTALQNISRQVCPFLSSYCTKALGDKATRTLSGVCSIRQVSPGSPSVICCPNRIYAENYKMLSIIGQQAFGQRYNLYSGRLALARAKEENGAVAVFGHGWGGELPLPKRKGKGSYYVDWILARLDGSAELAEFTAIEVQTIDTTGSYQNARRKLLENRTIEKDTVGLNWENVSKRIIPQIIYKGQVLQREELCRSGLYFVCPKPVYDRVLERLGGKEKLPQFPTQPAAIHFVAYDYLPGVPVTDGMIRPLGVIEEYCTTVYKVQEAFSAVDLPDQNVYRDAIRRSLYG
ncbi:MAG: hypothetical protein H9864_03080 [Candidatus Faecalibacterium intestinavium]|uniref:Restriction endonuclease type II NotI domain-containing protein n=1 Tax=Candidatus Faecalibacterium intestinavium TaxID=2838580 RepID=A0A9E2KK40_9FIRM|nr:hypothetical protein [Candidatus Faecalibacterium intestinavium]